MRFSFPPRPPTATPPVPTRQDLPPGRGWVGRQMPGPRARASVLRWYISPVGALLALRMALGCHSCQSESVTGGVFMNLG